MAFTSLIDSEESWSINEKLSFDNLNIRYGTFSDKKTPIERYVVYINGHGEFIEKYDNLPVKLKLPNNWGFLTWDHRGQGASGGEPRLHIESYDLVAQDAKDIISHVVGDKPYVIIAHSMGGLISLYAKMKGYLNPDKIILSAPLLGVQNPIPPIVAKGFSNIAVKLGKGGSYFQKHLDKNKHFEKNMFTHSKENFERRSLSPYKIEGVTFGWIKSTLDAIDFVTKQSNIETYDTDTMILYGDDERLVDVKAIKSWSELMRSVSQAKLVVRELKETRHELFMEAPKSFETTIGMIEDFVFGE